MTDTTPPPPAPQPHGRRVALVLQGGGALGSYQAGVYEALAAAGCLPDWVAGISIGAINAALIAGNPPERRGDALRAFWEQVSAPTALWPELPVPGWAQAVRQGALMSTLVFGQPGFFRPAPQVGSTTSYYDTSGLKGTLERLCDFDRINARTTRLSVGAVNVRTGNFAYFDNAQRRIVPEHIMASGALPPAFPAIRIEGEYYWDGGIVSNTPLQYLLDQEEDRSSLVFQVDLFSARGSLPRGMADVLSRHKDIMYSSRTRQNTDNFQRIHALKMKLLDALKRVPAEALRDGERELIDDYSNAGVVNIVHLIYQHKGYEGHAKDYEFSGTSMREHWEMGLEDTQRTLRHKQWLTLPTNADGVTIHDLHREDPT